MQGNLKNKRIQIPTTATPPYLLAPLDNTQQLLLYAPPPPPAKTEEPKKKFAFKTAPPAPTSELVHILDPRSLTWQTHQTKGKIPSRRSKVSWACLGPCLMVYGGRQVQPDKVLNDLYCLNLQSWQWKKLFTMEAPKPEQQIFLCPFGDQLILFGSQVWLFKAKGVTWQAESADLPGGVWEKLNLELTLRPVCGYEADGKLILFCLRGEAGAIEAVCLELLEEGPKLTTLTFSQKLESSRREVGLCSTSAGRGLVVDQTIFNPFHVDLQKKEIILGTPIKAPSSVEQLVPVGNANYAISDKHLQEILIEVEQQSEPEEEEDSYQQTARQIIREQPQHNRSIQERESYEESSSRPLPSPLSERQTSHILSRLVPLLAKEFERRKILQQKSLLLESTIKKAEKMVLALCKYGDQSQKQRHIAKVFKLREQLCKVHQTQQFLRKQMEERPGWNELRALAVKQTLGTHTDYL